jgi:putative FmdB family regulatory protein
MPNYEFRCIDCNHFFELFQTYQEYGSNPIKCPACESSQVERVIKPVRITRSDSDRFESYLDPGQLTGLEEDPQALGQMMRKMSQELGEDMGPEFDEVVDRLEKGQSPDEIEKDLPDLTDDGNSLGLDLE